MPLPTAKWIVLATLTVAALSSTACTRNDATGPSDQTAPSFEGQGANNGPRP